MASFFSKIFGGSIIKRREGVVSLINREEENLKNKSNSEIKEISNNLKSRIQAGEDEQSLLPLAFALVREAGKRTLKQRHFDVQLIGGMILHEGKIAEMLTGEGKTLVATLPAYF